jgi:hypothetical protein
MPAATNALKYQQGYVQSNTERYIKFRDEAYKELMETYGNELAYRKVLADREKALLDSIADAKKAGSNVKGKGMSELDYLTLRGKFEAEKAGSLEDSAKRRIGIEQGKKNEFNVPTSVANKISDASKFLATSGALLKTAAEAETAINAQIDSVAQAWTPGDRSALGAGQQLLNVLTTSPVYNQLTPVQKAAVVGRITDRAGLKTLDVAGISGAALLTSPLDQLLKMEVEDELKSYGAAYIGGIQNTIDMLDKSWKAQQEKAAAEGKAVDEVAVPTADETELEKIRKQLAAELPEKPTEAQVRALAREKFQPEASDFLRKQFERDAYASDADQSKLIHYDAIQAAKKMKLKEDSDAYKRAKMLVDTENKQMSPSQLRDATLRIAVDYSGGDLDKRDQFLQNYHAIKMQAQQQKYAPQEPLTAPPSESPMRRAVYGAPISDVTQAADKFQPVEREPYLSPVERLKALAAGPTQDLSLGQFGLSPEDFQYGEGSLTPEQMAAMKEASRTARKQNVARKIVGVGNRMEDLFKMDL